MNISVVIPLYNKEQTIRRSINSVLFQKQKPLEILVIDDGSTDGSGKNVKNLSSSLVKYYWQENMGASVARNNGAEFSCGDWIAFLDADDEYDPDFLSKCTEALKFYELHEISFISTGHVKPSSFEKGYAKSSYFEKTKFCLMNHKHAYKIINYFHLCSGAKTPASSSSVIVNKKAFREVGGFPAGVNHFEDWILWMKLACYGNFIYIFEPLSYYHKDQSSVSYLDNINVNELFLSATKLVSTANELKLQYRLNKKNLHNLITYVNSFILSETKFLLRRRCYKLGVKLILHFNLRFLKFTFIKQMLYLLALVVRQEMQQVKELYT